MIEPLPEDLVEEAWEEYSNFSTDQGDKEVRRVAKLQPNLLSFMIEVTEELDEDAKELGIFMFFVIHRMFEKGYGKKIRKVTEKEITTLHEENQNMLEELTDADEKTWETMVSSQISGQPYVFQYLVDTLFEEPEEDEEPEFLGEEDKSILFMVLKTVIDLLDRKTGG
jgi:hypothetical protein